MASKLVMWIEKTFYLAEQPLVLKLKIPSFVDSPEFAQRMEKVKTMGPEGDIFALLSGEWCEGVFSKWVRPKSPIETEDGTITTGKELFGIVNVGLVFDVLAELRRLVALTEAEGKASASPSTPPVGAARASDGSSSPAPSTGPVAGPTP